MQTINTEQLIQLKQRREDALLINVLDESAFAQEHIPGSINIPLGHSDFIGQVEQQAKGKGQKIVVYCASSTCNASPKAAKKLESAGFSNVYDYEAGMAGWTTAHMLIQSS